MNFMNIIIGIAIMGENVMSKIQLISEYFKYPFVIYAFIVAIMISIASSLLGVTLVLKRYSFIGDGLSHVAFGAMAIATIFDSLNNNVIVMIITILTAILLLRNGGNAKLKGDASIAVFSVGALAFGYFIMNVFSTGGNVSGDVCSTLFGSVSLLTLSREQVIFCVTVSIAVILLFIIFYNRIFAVTFDEDFLSATGEKAERYNLLIAVLIAIVIVLGMNLVGSLLISALVIFPSLSSMSLFNNYRAVVISSTIISCVCAGFGMLISMVASTPVGATIVITNICVYVICIVINKIK